MVSTKRTKFAEVAGGDVVPAAGPSVGGYGFVLRLGEILFDVTCSSRYNSDWFGIGSLVRFVCRFACRVCVCVLVWCSPFVLSVCVLRLCSRFVLSFCVQIQVTVEVRVVLAYTLACMHLSSVIAFIVIVA